MKKVSVSTLSQDRFKQDFVISLSRNGFGLCRVNRLWLNATLQSLFAHLRYNISFYTKKNICKIVPKNGALLIHESLPYCFDQEIIPFLWDCWPGMWDKLVFSLSKLKVRLCFVTSTQVQSMLKERLPNLNCVYVPEAVNAERFSKGPILVDRTIKVFEVGRKHYQYHNILNDYFPKENGFVSNYVKDFYGTIANSQITISFPQCDTNFQMAGVVETLTERYWESMLSRSLILGRAPQELIDLIGYNPVINVDWEHPQKQLKDLLTNIDQYQELVDRNYEVARQKGTWESRIPIIKDSLKTMGYIWQ